MDGILLINKDSGMTSRLVCDIVSKKLNTKKVGHTGTLDPLASGLLVVLVGNATKLANYLDLDNKVYEATIMLGIDTDTYDILGKTVSSSNKIVSKEEIDKALLELKDTKTQIPPIYSAIKVKGKKLYDYALEGKDVEIKERAVRIDYLERTSEIFEVDGKTCFKVKMRVNKGFYVRSLIHDLGIKLGTYATMSGLVRLESAIFTLENGYTLNDIDNNNYKLLSIEEAFTNFTRIDVNNYIASLVKNGVVLDERQYQGNSIFRVYNNDKLIALYEPKEDGKYHIIMKVGE